jgi:hypothetical protein
VPRGGQWRMAKGGAVAASEGSHLDAGMPYGELAGRGPGVGGRAMSQRSLPSSRGDGGRPPTRDGGTSRGHCLMGKGRGGEGCPLLGPGQRLTRHCS